MKPKLEQLAVLILAIVIAMPSINCKRFSPNRDDAKFKEVQQLSSTLPVYSDFRSTGEGSTYSKSMVASIHKQYRSNARYEDVKKFYSTQLTQTGWRLVKETPLKDGWSQDLGGRELRFEKGQYSMVIEYIGEKAFDPDWEYAVSVVWDDK